MSLDLSDQMLQSTRCHQLIKSNITNKLQKHLHVVPQRSCWQEVHGQQALSKSISLRRPCRSSESRVVSKCCPDKSGNIGISSVSSSTSSAPPLGPQRFKQDYPHESVQRLHGRCRILTSSPKVLPLNELQSIHGHGNLPSLRDREVR